MNKIILNKIINQKMYNFINFSTFKNKFEILQTASHSNLSEMYNHMTTFENNLETLEKLKYRKALENIEKKAKKLTRKEKEIHEEEILQMNFLIPFNVSMSHEFFYKIENNQYQPINETMTINKIDLEKLYNIIHNNKQSNFYKNLEETKNKILSNPSENETLYELIKTRCEYFEEQLCLNIYENYSEFLKENQFEINESMSKNYALKKLKNSKKNDIVFKKDLKFTLRKDLTPKENFIASEIAKTLTKYGFTTEKTMMFSMKSLSNEGYQSLTPKSLKNHFFILAYHQVQVEEINENLFKIYDLIETQSKKENEQEHLGEIGSINSLLFYMLSNKIETFEIYKSITNSINEKSKNIENIQSEKNQEICNIEKEIFHILISLLKEKYSLNIKLPEINIPKVESNSHIDFEKYLLKKQYTFNKIEKEGNKQLITDEIVFEIEDKSFISLHLSHINKNNGKPNGIGELLLEYFRAINKNIKIINPFVLNKCEKWGEKEDYFKSKLKGIEEPEVERKKWYD